LQKEAFNKDNPADLYPEYYLLKINQFNDIAKNTLDEWIFFLKNEEIKKNFTAKGLKKAKEELDIMKLSDEERALYMKYSDDLHYQASMYQSTYVTGHLEGEKKAKLEIAKSLLDVLDVETIAKKTGLTVEEIKKLIIDIDADKN
jgi:predicted transposase/invertase (TIGR01784 family)